MTTLRYSELERVAFLERCVCPEKKVKKNTLKAFLERCVGPAPTAGEGVTGGGREGERGGEGVITCTYLHACTRMSTK